LAPLTTARIKPGGHAHFQVGKEEGNFFAVGLGAGFFGVTILLFQLRLLATPRAHTKPA
jgi:hypothetical protein